MRNGALDVLAAVIIIAFLSVALVAAAQELGVPGTALSLVLGLAVSWALFRVGGWLARHAG